MEILFILLFVLISYLLGSVPTAVWVGKAFYGIDVRDFGSGNAGATNTFRVLGVKAGLLVFLIDFAKGFTAASLVRFFGTIDPSSVRWVNIQLLFGVSAVFGHIFPVFAKFKGGKGIATLFGMVVAIHYEPALYCAAIFILMLLFTRYVSLSSMSAVVLFPVLLIYVFREDAQLLIAFGITAAIMVILTHQKNIKRLLAGAENKANILPRHRRDRNL